jgi:hypothetical protein
LSFALWQNFTPKNKKTRWSIEEREREREMGKGSIVGFDNIGTMSGTWHVGGAQLMEKTGVMLLWQTRRIIETWMRKRACDLFVCFLLVRLFSCFLLQRKDFGCVGGVEIWAAFLSRCCIWDRAQDCCNWAWEKAVSIDPIFTQFEHLCSIRCTSERESVRACARVSVYGIHRLCGTRRWWESLCPWVL